MKGVFIFLAEGFEEIEALATVDILRRGGINARTVSINTDKEVKGAHGVPVTADLDWDGFRSEVKTEGTDRKDVMVFPGGLPGARHLADNHNLMELMKSHYAEGGTVAAICAAPGLVVSQLPTLEGQRFTCYDGFEEEPIAKGGEYVKTPAVTSGNLITGRGPGCAIDFALAIVGHVTSPALAEGFRAAMMLS